MISNYIEKHYAKNWGNRFSKSKSLKGHIHDISNDFSVLVFPKTTKRKFWTYATSGMSSLTEVRKMELHIFSLDEDPFLVELLSSIAFYQFESEDKLGLWHTVNFGTPWKPHSNCEYGLISLPYLDGSKLEKLVVENQLVNFYWLIPITSDEREYKKARGIEALEELFEEKNFNYLEPKRSSVV